MRSMSLVDDFNGMPLMLSYPGGTDQIKRPARPTVSTLSNCIQGRLLCRCWDDGGKVIPYQFLHLWIGLLSICGAKLERITVHIASSMLMSIILDIECLDCGEEILWGNQVAGDLLTHYLCSDGCA